MKSLFILALLLASFVSAFDNTPPIPERVPGWSDGKNHEQISF